MMSGKRVTLALAAIWLGVAMAPTPVCADGGTWRFSGRRGDHLVTVFTAPAPLRAGTIDLSVLVQDAESGRAITELSVEMRAERTGDAESKISASATVDAATNKLMRAASVDLPKPGRWRFEVFVQGTPKSPPIEFDAEVLEPLPTWLQVIPWFAWPVVPIGLFAIHQLGLRGKRMPARKKV